MNEQWSPEERRLRDALHRAAEQVTPGPDGLARIRRRTAQPPWWRNPAFIGVAAGVATASAAIVIAVNALQPGPDEATMRSGEPAAPVSPTPDNRDDAGRADEPTSDPDKPADGSGTADEPSGDVGETAPPDDATEPGTVALPAYFTLDGRLTREWHPVATDADLLVEAVRRSLNAEARDPRYGSLWSSTQVHSVQIRDEAIEVNLDAPAELADADASAQRAVQQLVYTVTAAASATSDEVDQALPVRILVDGSAPDDLFGQLDVTEPVTRAAQEDVRYFVQVDTPTYDAEVVPPVTVSGVAAVFEGTVLWELRRDGELVDSGHTTTDEAHTFSPYSITLGDLEPGRYEITVTEDDASGGAGPDPRYETKRFTVVPEP